MQTRHLLQFESFGKLITLKRKKSGVYDRFNILAGRVVVGTIECYLEGRNLNVSSIEIQDASRSNGYGVKALRELLNEYRLGYTRPESIFADCVSKHSLKTFVKAYGHPDYMGDDYDEYTSVEDALETMRDYAEFDEDGAIMGGGAIQVRFDYATAFTHINA